MRQMVTSGELGDLVPERVWQEVQRALHEQAPGVFFDVLRELGALQVLIPELTDEQPFRQGLSALQCIHRKQGGSTAQHYAALLSGVPEPDAVARAKAMKSPPNDCRELTHLVGLFMAQLNGASPETRLTPELAMELLDKADFWRRPDRFGVLLGTLACTLQSEPDHLIQQLELAAHRAQSVTPPHPFLQKGIQGKALGEAIRKERVARITEALHLPE